MNSIRKNSVSSLKLAIQKLTNQELILLAALDHLSEDNDSDDDESDNV